MTGDQSLMTDFGQNFLIYSLLIAACSALVVSVIGLAIGNHRNGYRLRKLLAEVGGAAGLAWLLAGTIAETSNPALFAAGLGAAWSATYQYLRIGVTRLLLLRYSHFAEGFSE